MQCGLGASVGLEGLKTTRMGVKPCPIHQRCGSWDKLILLAEGADAEKAIQELELLIEKRFDEE